MTELNFYLIPLDTRDDDLAKLRDGTRQVRTLGELTQKRPRRLASNRPITPTGCQWARDCEKCPWDDCVISDDRVHSYDSEEAKRIRERFLDESRIAGMTVKELAAAMKISENSVIRRSSTKTSIKDVRYRIMVQARMGGMSERKVAERFGVHRDVVARAVRKVLGKKPKDSGYHRIASDRKSYTAPLHSSSTDVLRKNFEPITRRK